MGRSLFPASILAIVECGRSALATGATTLSSGSISVMEKNQRAASLLRVNTSNPLSLAAAKDALVSLLQNRKQNTLPQRGRKPAFSTFAAQYLQMASTRQKRERTHEKEVQAIELWQAHLGGARIDRVSTPMIKDFVKNG